MYNGLNLVLGWSSGPTALRMACDHGHKDIYILGFDYQGHKQDDKGKHLSLTTYSRTQETTNKATTKQHFTATG